MYGTEHGGGGVSLGDELPGQISVRAKYSPDSAAVPRGSVYVPGIKTQGELPHLCRAARHVHRQFYHSVGTSGTDLPQVTLNQQKD